MAESFSGIKHKNQRVGVFIDVQNLYYSARHLYHSKVNFGEILKAAVGERQLIRAIAYVVRATGEEDTFFEALNQRGLETKEREVQEFKDGSKKADWDVGIAVDAIRISEIVDVIVLVSGDGDFVEMVEYLQHHGRQVEAIAFKSSASQKLIAAVDDFTDLGAEKEKYLIKYTNRGSKRDAEKDGGSDKGNDERRQQRKREPRGDGKANKFFGPDAS
jgi:uncharacterized LabA/DUF88 family protein